MGLGSSLSFIAFTEYVMLKSIEENTQYFITDFNIQHIIERVKIRCYHFQYFFTEFL